MIEPKALSIDFETLSLEPNCALLSVGVVVFNPSKVQTYEEMIQTAPNLYMVFDTKDQREIFGRHFCPETSAWWDDQDDAARDAIFKHPNKVGYQSGLVSLVKWIEGMKLVEGVSKLWSYGAASDAVWLESACKSVGLKMPFSYREIRCLRTMAAEFDIACPNVPNTVKHHSLHDALVQAMWVQRIQAAKGGINAQLAQQAA